MPFLCTQCNINWARLQSQDDGGDEQYEACPVCRTDIYLQKSDSNDTFMYSEITGQVINVQTRKELNRNPVVEVAVSQTRSQKDIEDKYNELDEQQDRAIDAYHKALEKGEDGKAAYFKTFNKK